MPETLTYSDNYGSTTLAWSGETQTWQGSMIVSTTDTDAKPIGPSDYGYCPVCGAPCAMRERRLNGNDICEKGHEYPSRDAVKGETKAKD